MDTKTIPYRIVDHLTSDRAGERARVVDALMATPASISPKYFYDELGCALYGAICRLPEYYPTRTEASIFTEHRLEIATAVGQGKQFVDLGAGDCCKAQSWFAFISPTRYIAVDIARAEIEKALARMAPDFPEVEMLGVIADFTKGLPLADARLEPRHVFLPGSSIGNFTPEEACASSRACTALRTQPGKGLLIGVDGKKDRVVLTPPTTTLRDRSVQPQRAESPQPAIRFRLRARRLYARSFYNEAWAHRDAPGVAARPGRAVGSRTRQFAAGERIHTENSYKYHAREFQALLRDAGLSASSTGRARTTASSSSTRPERARGQWPRSAA